MSGPNTNYYTAANCNNLDSTDKLNYLGRTVICQKKTLPQLMHLMQRATSQITSNFWDDRRFVLMLYL